MLKIAFDKIYHHPLPEGHRFPMLKYSLIPEQLLYEGSCEPDNFFAPGALGEETILGTHDVAYWEKLKTQNLSRQEERRTGFPLTPELVRREQVICQGTIDTTNYAMEFGVSMNVAGGTHHAYFDRGEGFCLLNDNALAANYLLEHKDIRQILIVDLDVHQGNGTASLFENENRVFTFSMHGRNNYPLHKERSDLDIELEDGTTDDFYLKTLDHNLKSLMDMLEPEFVFFQSGVDVLETDKLGRLALSKKGCSNRDRMVLEVCKKNKVPLAINMGGGYSVEIRDIVEAHANTYRLAQEIYF